VRLAATWEVVDVGLDLRTLTFAYGSGGCRRGADPVRAREVAPAARRPTRRIHGVFEHRRDASTAWVLGAAAALRERARRCVYGPLGRPRP
jgi:hypothetical protein